MNLNEDEVRKLALAVRENEKVATKGTASFSPEDLATLHAIALRGKAEIEKLILLRRKTAGDWHRLNQLRDSGEQSADSSISLSPTAPNTPPCILTIFTAAAWLPGSVAPQQSSSSRHSKPRSLASRIVV